jgi:hypothetical protein
MPFVHTIKNSDGDSGPLYSVFRQLPQRRDVYKMIFSGYHDFLINPETSEK